MSMKTEVIPTILAKNRSEAVKQLKRAARVANKVQIDIIDGKFAPNKTVLPSAFIGLKSRLLFEFQLMVKQPERLVEEIAKVKQAKLVIFHVESLHSKKRAIELFARARAHGLRAGIALNPETDRKSVV